MTYWCQPTPPVTHSLTLPLTVDLAVVAGGYLDVRFLTLYRAPARRLNNNRTQVSIGSTAMVDFGGTFIGTG